ncbi:MAG: hypothetical protein AUJ96_06385 [Armatimonadetes bacterium CG2_30_66_41]|nr:hypothetical protein [Armatimonadota bacterium]OIP08090.1 MAG: hypothetical protein AUJ96_06385 [Armatimonadetes bacterium CG2_30_66_41]NCO90603.1 hypothetical protein [Armatimonadota bacterium]NCP30662.1 hypothetical protein [Armatimonadota bacterium]NCQ30993.1 hypothetical protein [Armatimonadota bacterium]
MNGHSPIASDTVGRAPLLGTVLVLTFCPFARAEGDVSSLAFVEDGKPTATEVLGKAWEQRDGYLECVGGNTIAERLLGRCSLGAGDFRVAARLALVKLASSAAAFTLGDNNYCGFAGGHGKVFVTGPWFNDAAGAAIGEPTDFMQDGVPFDFEVTRQGDQLRILIDGKQAYEQKVTTGALGAPGFTPVRSTMRIYGFSATGSLEPYKAPKPPVPFKDNVVLDPRVTPLPGLPHGPFVRLGDGGILGVDEMNAVVTRDDGKTWEQHPLFKPGEAFKVRPERALLRTRSGATILIFANDAVLKYSWDKDANLPKPDMHLPSYSIRSLDDGKTWQDLNLLQDGWCGCIQDILQTSNGNVVVPGQELLYKEGRHATMPYVSADDGKTWQRTRYLDIGGQGDHAGAIEGTLVELRDGRLWLLLRSYDGFFYESFSGDQGMTWTDPKPSKIKSTGSPGKLKRLASGRLVFLWNAIPNEGYVRREQLSISFSEDDGQTWTPPQVIATNKGGRVSYPDLFAHSAGEWWITTMQGSMRASLKESDFMENWTKIVAFGDSTTAPRGDLPIYADLLQQELPAKGVDTRVINAGVGGNTTDDARKRFQQDVLDRKPQGAIIQFGINDSAVDVWKTPPATEPRVALARYRENLEFFVGALRQQGARVILMTPNPLRWTDKTKALYGKPPYRPDDPTGFNALLPSYAEAVRQLAQKEQVELVDVAAQYEAFDKQEGQSMEDLLLDGMHPNEKGHRLAADLLLEKIVAAAGH